MEKNKLKLLFLGLVTGLINGVFGSGGGMIIVPSLVFFLHFKDYKAHATAISIILPISIVSNIVYFINNAPPLKTSLIVMAGGLVGSFIGAKLLNKIPGKILRKVFGCVTLYTAIRMIWR